MQVVLENLPFLLRAALVTLGYAAGSMIPGFLLGLVTALARLSSVKPFEWIARTYVSLIRGTPLLVQIYVVYYVLPDLGFDIGPLWSGVLALSLNVGAYASEALRGAFLAVPKGQGEAARALGLSSWHTFRDVEGPQALRIAVPALGNSFISLVKDTSLVSVITVVELLQEANLIIARTFQPTPIYLTVALIYWAICSVLSLGLRRIEHQLSKSTRASR